MDDLDIAMRFGEWAAAERLTSEPYDDDAELAERCAAADAIACRLAAIPAAGLVGFVLKTVLLLHHLDGSATTEAIAIALLDDAGRLVPELHGVLSKRGRLIRLIEMR